MTEDLFQYLWKMRLFNQQGLITTDGEEIEIKKVGLQNINGGPDFFDARININNTLWAGNVELHIKSSDWLLHQHQHDASYQNIILHVVYQHDKEIFNNQGQSIKTLELKNYIDNTLIENYEELKKNEDVIPCAKSIGTIAKSIINTQLQGVIVQRLENKTKSIERLLAENNNNWEQSFYLQLASNFGFKVNSIPFEMVARNTSLNILAKHKNNLLQLEALLLGQAGFLDQTLFSSYAKNLQNEYEYLKRKYQLNFIAPHLWKLSRLRPVNFPEVRLAQFAALIHNSSHLFSKIIQTQSPQEMLKLFQISASSFWDNHYTLNSQSKKTEKVLGLSSIQNIIINTVVPFIFVYGKQYKNEDMSQLALDLLEKIPPEKNSIIEMWKAIGVKPENALESQALIELRNNYCLKKKCLACSIGYYVLKNQ